MDSFFEAKIKIRHRGCYSDGFTTKFPNIKTECFNMQFVNKSAQDLFRFSGDSKEFNNLIKYLKAHKVVKSVTVLQRDKSSLCLKITSVEVPGVKQISEVVFTKDAFYTKPLIYEDNSEIWFIGSASKATLKQIVEEMKEHGKLELLGIKNSAFKATLTEKESSALITAKILGYYEWPRKTTTSEIAKQLGIKKTALLHRLRNAEQKIINESIRP